MSRSGPSRLAVVLLVLATAAPAWAQIAGSVRGTVSDKTGAVLPGAAVVLTNEATKFSREAATDDRGGYFFASVDPGNYALKVSLSGFKTYEARVRVSTSDTLGVDVTLEVGMQTESVVVTADRTLIQTETGAREGLITPEQIEKISIVGRNPLELLRTLPGVVTPEQGNFERAGIGEGFGNVNTPWAINGARPQNLAVTIDGANLRDIGNNSGMMNVPNNEFVAEVKVQMSNYAAEFGSSAVNVTAVTKSGSSEFHGSVYDYLRHYELAANDRARNYADQERPEEKFHYPGFTFSGPILIPGTSFNRNRDKAFFFVGWEWQRQVTAPDARFGVVPTLGMRQGMFNDYLAGQHLNLPSTVNIPRGFPGAGTPAPNNDLRPYLDPIGQALMGLWPEPNYVDRDNRYNYIFNPTQDLNRNQGVIRLDYNISDNTRAYVRLARDSELNQNARGLWWGAGNIELPSPVDLSSVGRSAVFNLTSVLSPTTTNEFIFTWSRLTNDNHFNDPAAMQLSSYGAATGLSNPFGGSGFIPDMVMEFDSSQSLWFAQDVDNIFSYNGFLRFGDSLTKVYNTHAIKVGGIVERQYKQQNFQLQNNIQLNFAPWGNGSTGNEFADLLVGRPANAVIGQPAARGDFVAWNLEFFAQDSWKVSKKFTFEYGLRVGRWTNSAETNDIGGVFLPELYDPSQGYLIGADRRANGWAYAATGEVDSALTESRPFLIMPRVNFAWDISGTGDTIIRGGGGIFFNREQGNAQYDVIKLPPNAYNVTLDAGSLQNINGGNGLTLGAIGGVDPFSVGASPGELNSVNPNSLDWPKYYQVSASVVRRIFSTQTLEVGYVGNFGRNLAARQKINVIPGGGLNADFPDPAQRAALADGAINSRRPFPAYGDNLNYLTNIGYSNYHGLQATLSKPMGNFTYLLAYTLSSSKGTVTSDYGVVDAFDPDNRNFGWLPSDRRHQASLSWTWQLGDPAKGGFAAAVLNGWNVSGISTYSTGQPIRLGFSGDLNGDQMHRAWFGTHDHANFDALGGDQGPGDITPVFTCDPRRSGGNSVGDKILDINCIGIPGFGQTGPFISPFDLRTPSRNFHDITLFKDFRLGGDRRLQFRVGAFNVFNQAYPVYRVNGLNDFDLALEANCNRRLTGVPNGAGGTSDVCDPTGGFTFTQNTLNNFGKIITKRGHRVIELALRFFF